MASEPAKPKEKTAAPSIKVRLAWWFGIYLAAQMSLILGYGPTGAFISLLFPAALLIAPIYWLLGNSIDTMTFALFSVIVGYAFYLGHLYATTKVRTRRGFDFLLLILVVVVLYNEICSLMGI